MKALFASPIAFALSVLASAAFAQQPTIELESVRPDILRLSWLEADPTFLVEVSDDLGRKDAWLPLPALPVRDAIGPFFELNPIEGDPILFYRLREDHFPAGVAVSMPDATTVRVGWDFTYKNYILESSDDRVNWIPEARAPQIVGDKYMLDLPVVTAAQFYRVRSNRAPTLSVPSAATVNIGETGQFTITAEEPDNDRLHYDVIGLPEGAGFDPNTGVLTIKPQPGQAGTYDISITATDSYAATTRVLRLTVPPPPQRTTTAVRGRILDANGAAQGQTLPIAGVTVTLLTTGHSTTTDANGNFRIEGVPADLQVLNLDPTDAVLAPDGSKYAGFREEVTLLPMIENVINRPLYLPRIAMASLSMVNPNQTTVIENTAIGVSITVPANTATAGGALTYDGPISISEVPLGYAPAAMPDELQPSLVITLQPVGVAFSQPVPITFPNRDDLDPNSEVDLWSLDAGTGVFVVVGTGKVSADGTKIETIAGGVRATDWHFPLPTPPQTDPTQDDDGDGTTCPGGSAVLLHNGAMLTDIALPSYFSMGQERIVRLKYSSRHAEPFSLISANFTQTARQPRPRYLALATEADGAVSGQRWYSLTTARARSHGTGEAGAVSGQRSLASGGSTEATWSAAVSHINRPTGIHPVGIRASYRWQRGNNPPSTRTGLREISTAVVNRHDSPYGIGWSVEGVQRIYANSNLSSVLLVEDTNAKIFSRGVALNQVALFEQGQPLPFPTAAANITTYGLAAADFNGDGILDLAVTQDGSTTEEGIHVFTGTGRASFIHLLRVPISGGEPKGLVSADFDRDGIADLAVSTGTGRRVIVFKGIGNGNFSQTESISLSIRTPELHAGDLDGNGSIDLVTVTDATGAGDDLAVLLNDGMGNFTSTGTQDPLGNPTIRVSALADMNGDVRPDLVFGRFTSGGVSVALNNGSGQFSPAMHFIEGGGVEGIACADYTGDGRADVLAGSGQSCTLFRNTGGGVLQRDADPAFSFPGGAMRSFTDPTPRDIDGDGKMDAVFVSSGGNFLVAAYGNGTGGFDARAFAMFPSDGDPTHDIANDGALQGVLVADFNGDGTNDVAAARVNNPVGAAVVLGKAARDFATPRVFTSINPVSSSRSAVAADFDRDGLTDVLVLGSSGSSALEFSKGRADGSFGAHETALPRDKVNLSGFRGNMRRADFDRDGNLDVIFSGGTGVQGSPGPRILVAWGLGNGTFRQDLGGSSNLWIVAEGGSPSNNQSPVNIVPGDFNNDGFVDYANVFTDRVSIHLYDLAKPRTFVIAAHTFVPFAGTIADAAATGDVNGDGKLDLFLLERSPGQDPGTLFYAVYAGNGNGTFTRIEQNFTGFTQSFTPRPGANLIPIEYDVGSATFREALLSDLNKDGFVDVVFSGSNGAWLMTGDGKGRFSPPRVLTGAFDRAAGPIALLDVDGDSFDELAVGEVDLFARGVAILPNVGGRQVFGDPVTVPVPSSITQALFAFDQNQDGKDDLIVFHSEEGLSQDRYAFAVLRNIFGQSTAINQFEGQFVSPPGDFSRLRVNEDGTYTRAYPNGTVVQLDAQGRHLNTTDRNGNVTRYQYVAPDSDVLAGIIEPGGQQVTLSYANRLLASISTPAGTTRLTFEGDEPPQDFVKGCGLRENRLKRVTFPDGTTRQFTYLNYHEPPPPPRASGGGGGAGFVPIRFDPCQHVRLTGLLIDEIDGEGNASTHSYEFGRLRNVQLEEGLIRQFTSPQQGIAFFTVSTNDSPLSAIPPSRPGDRIGYYVEGNRVEGFKTGPNGKVIEELRGTIKTTAERDGNGLITRLLWPSGHRFDMTWDGAGNLLTIADNQTGGTTAFEYEPLFNQVTKIIHPEDAGAETTFEYDAEGNLTGIATPERRTVRGQFRGDGQIVAFTSQTGTVSTFEYDAASRLTRVREGSGADERVTQFEHDPAGRLTRVRDAENHLSQLDYFDSGTLRSAIWPDGAIVTFQENHNRAMTAALLPAAAGTVQHSWTYDGLKRISSYAPPGVPTLHYDYNVHSEPTRLRSGGATLIEILYNARGQIASIQLKQPSAAPLSVTNQYNETTTGLITRSDSSDGITVTPTFSGRILRRLQWTGAVAGSFEITFDDRYRIMSDRVNSETPVAYTYDRDSLLLTAGALQVVRRPADGLIAKITIGNITETFDYNAFGELINHSADFASAPLFSASYRRDKLGRVTRAEETIAAATTTFDYEYDSAGRLERVLANAVPSETYTYDPRGNLSNDTLHGAHSFNSADQLLSAGAATFTYTDDGTRLTKSVGGQTSRYHYTSAGQLRRVELPDGRVIRYLHDGVLDRLVKEVDGAVTAKFLCPLGNAPVAELDAANQVVSRFIYGTRQNLPEYFIKDGATYRIIADHTGSPRLIVDALMGTIAQQLSYDAYGRVLMDTAPGFQPFGYAGGWYDPDTKLVRFGARDYDAEFRRWTTRDPLGFDSGDANLYAYAFNDPVNVSDPNGTSPLIPRHRGDNILDVLERQNRGEFVSDDDFATAIEKEDRRVQVAIVTGQVLTTTGQLVVMAVPGPRGAGTRVAGPGLRGAPVRPLRGNFPGRQHTIRGTPGTGGNVRPGGYPSSRSTTTPGSAPSKPASPSAQPGAPSGEPGDPLLDYL